MSLRQFDAPPINPADTARAVDAFWRWWNSGGADALDRHFAKPPESSSPADAAASEATVKELDRLVHDIHQDLEWEVGPGGELSRHLMTVTAAHDPGLRAEARRWLDAAPAADDAWSFGDLRPPTPDAAVEIGGQTYFTDECLVSIRAGMSLIHVTVYHPSIVMTSTPSKKIAYLMLDALLGEEAMDLWIGSVDGVADPDPGSVPFYQLRDEVERMDRGFSAKGGKRRWQLIESKQSAGPTSISVAPPLDPIAAPLSTEYVLATVEYSDRIEQGMPGPAALEKLRDFEDLLLSRFAGHEWLVAVETSSGRRRFHLYRDPTAATRTPLDRWLATWTDGPVELHTEHDPDWDNVQKYRV